MLFVTTQWQQSAARLQCMRIDAFRPAAEFKEHMDRWISRFRQAKTSEEYDKVLIPGDPERASESERRSHGIPLLQPVIEDLKNLGERLSIAVKF